MSGPVVKKPHLIKTAGKYNANAEIYLPFVVPGSTTSTSSTSSPQDLASAASVPSLVSTRSQSARSRARRDLLHDLVT